MPWEAWLESRPEPPVSRVKCEALWAFRSRPMSLSALRSTSMIRTSTITWLAALTFTSEDTDLGA